jgi:hypothetical protein
MAALQFLRLQTKLALSCRHYVVARSGAALEAFENSAVGYAMTN